MRIPLLPFPWLAVLLLAPLLALPAPSAVEAAEGTVCRTAPVRVRIGRARTPRLYVLETHCYRRDHHSRIDTLRAACDLLVTAYGEDEGRTRCRALVEDESPL